MKQQPMPTVFVGHGSPMNALHDNLYSRAWRRLGKQLPRPSAILAISAHWYTRGIRVTASAQPVTIHDFHGFPTALYECQYPAPGAPGIAQEVRQLLRPLTVELREDWGLDHGSWSVLMRMYPRAEIPTLQLSIDADRPAEFHYRLGRQLRPLRDRGVLILASGNVVHNLDRIQWSDDAPPYPWAARFNRDVRDALARGDHRYLVDFADAGEDARLSIPSPEHFLPLLYVAGASTPEDRVSFPVDGIANASISMLSALFAQ